MAEQHPPGAPPGKDGADLEEAVRDEVSEARREIFSAYLRARARGVLMAQDPPDYDPPDD
jgi:hypothetical protein